MIPAAGRILGKNSSSRYVFCATSPEDAGKELRIEIKTHAGKYSGVVNAVYRGDKFEIWEYIFSCYGFETILAFFILFTGIFTIIFSLALGIVYQTKFDMEYLQLLSAQFGPHLFTILKTKLPTKIIWL